MNTHKHYVYRLLITALLLFAVSGCGSIMSAEGKGSGPRPPQKTWQPPQRDINALADCHAQIPGVKLDWDILTGYYGVEGENSEKYKECLKTKHGWFELGPPHYKEGVMAPPA